MEAVKAYGRRNDIHNGVDGSHFMEMNFLDGKVVGFRFRLCHNAENLLCQSPGRFGHVRAINDRFHIFQMAVLVMMVPLSMVMMVMVFMTVTVVLFFLVMVSIFMAVAVVFFLLMMVTFFMAVAVVLFLFVMMAFFLMMVMVFFMNLFPCFRQGTVEIGHVVVMVFMVFVQNHVEIAAVNACFLHSSDFHCKPFGRNGRKRFIQRFPVRSQVQQGCHKHIPRNAGGCFQI